jgi:hypothetical protein
VLPSIKLNNNTATTSGRTEEQRMKSLKEWNIIKSTKIKFYTIWRGEEEKEENENKKKVK